MKIEKAKHWIFLVLVVFVLMGITGFAVHYWGADTEVTDVEQEDVEQEEITSEEDFLSSMPGTRWKTTQADGVVERIKTLHGSVTVTKNSKGIPPQITFREAGSAGLLFPTYTGNPSRVELGLVAGENHYPPSIDIPLELRNMGYSHESWIHVQDESLAGRHRQAVIDTGCVWALKPPPSGGKG